MIGIFSTQLAKSFVKSSFHYTSLAGTRRRSTGGGQSYLWSGVWKWSKVACTTSFFAYFLLSPESKTSLCKSSTPTRFQSHVLVCKLLFCPFYRCRRKSWNVWGRSSLSIIFWELPQRVCFQFCYDDLMLMGCYWLHWAVLSCRELQWILLACTEAISGKRLAKPDSINLWILNAVLRDANPSKKCSFRFSES